MTLKYLLRTFYFIKKKFDVRKYITNIYSEYRYTSNEIEHIFTKTHGASSHGYHI